MTAVSALLLSIGICVLGAILEGIAAGSNIKPLFAKLRFPSYSAPLWVWYIIGVLYYATYGFILYRILRYDGVSILRPIAFALVLVIMAANAFWNYVFFRAQRLYYGFVVGLLYSVVAFALFVCLLQFDRVAAWAQVPYLLYLTYAYRWSRGLLRLNSHLR
ncbi:MAG TPA: TspO/MBR family protein [Pyrinomonadaceae bacterium]|nr:TspO/MBR family protein [Pyrinomonadaceae bacterium]